MEVFSFSETAFERLDQLVRWLLAEVLTGPNLAQIPAVLATGVLAWLVARPVRARLDAWIAGGAPGHFGWVVRHRLWATRLLRLIAPAFWAIGLWVSMVAARHWGWPLDIVRIAANLVLAWVIIGLVADLVPSPALARLIAIVTWALAALNIVHLLGPVAELLDSAAITLGTLRVSLLTLIKGVLSLAALLWLSALASRFLQGRLATLTELTPRAQVLVAKLLQVTLITLAVVLSLTIVGIDLSTLAILTGAIGVGIGLGLQKTVSNLFSGIVLLLDRSIKPGDVIEVGGTYGWVSFLGARYVSVETRDGMEYLIPNEDIITHQVLNWSHKSNRVRLKVRVRAPLDADLDLVLSLMRKAAEQPPRILKDPPPNPLVLGFGESAIELELRFWIEDAPNGVHNVKSEVLVAIWRLFRENGIRMPYPKRDLFLRSAAGDEADAPAVEDLPRRLRS